MSNLPDFIHGVLNRRHAHKPALEKVQRNLETLTGDLNQPAEAPPSLKQIACELTVSLANLKSRIPDLQVKIANLMLRFGKNTINIGVAGKARQGKSTVLQSISGLDDGVIPTSAGLPCTGAKSKIFHQEQKPHAVIEFYTEEEFLKGIVHAYYEELGIPHPPRTLSQFQQPLPPTAAILPVKHGIYQKLAELHKGMEQIGRYLSHKPGPIALDKVRDFVSQDEGRMNYLAVKSASIYVRFPNRDVVGLGIIDLPGLGEIALGHGHKLVASLQQEVDVVLVVKRPELGGSLLLQR